MRTVAASLFVREKVRVESQRVRCPWNSGYYDERVIGVNTKIRNGKEQ